MHFTNHPRVSVVMATFNRSSHLDAAIGSVLGQTLRDWELIVVDDGSSDGTFDVVDRYTREHDNVRYMKHRNRKQALARNAGIQAAFGSYITFLDSDDRYLPEHLEARCRMLDSMPEVDLLAGGFVCHGDPLVRDRHDPRRLVHVDECILAGTLFGRRQLFVDLQGFRPIDYSEDADLWERAMERHRVMKIDEPRSYLYFRSEESVTGNHKKTKP